MWGRGKKVNNTNLQVLDNKMQHLFDSNSGLKSKTIDSPLLYLNWLLFYCLVKKYNSLNLNFVILLE